MKPTTPKATAAIASLFPVSCYLFIVICLTPLYSIDTIFSIAYRGLCGGGKKSLYQGADGGTGRRAGLKIQ